MLVLLVMELVVILLVVVVVVAGRVLASVLCVTACRRPVNKGGRGMQIILKKLYLREKLGIRGKFLDLSRKNPFGFGPK
jgi:hypothetical protein